MRLGSTGAFVGLTLLEAAAVPGEPLAVEALAAALGHGSPRSPSPGASPSR